MRTKLGVLLAVLASVLVTSGSAGADHVETEPIWPCTISADAASATDPHVVDPTGDWSGWVTGNEQGGYGDLYREGIDLKALWFDRQDGTVRANVQIADLGLVQPNTIFYVIWYYPDGDNVELNGELRWASARLKEYDETVFTYGHMAESVTGNLLFKSEGLTTGSLTRGPDAVATIDLTPDALNGAHAGDHLFPVLGMQDLTPMEARILLGSPETLPEPSPFRHGFVSVADTAGNLTKGCNVLL